MYKFVQQDLVLNCSIEHPDQVLKIAQCRFEVVLVMIHVSK